MHIRVAAAVLAAVVLAGASGCGGGGFFGRQYEYEEDLTLAIDGSATLIVNASLPALAALRGFSLPLDPDARVDRDAIEALYQSPVSEVTRVGRPWTRGGRRFVQIRIDVPDITRLSEAAPFAWSRYEFGAVEGPGPDTEPRTPDPGPRHVFKQTVGPAALKPGTLQNVGWDGSEIVAFRVHLPSKILFHNARDLETNNTSDIRRGNILAWEQHLADRLDGQPVEIHIEMESESILHRTLLLFAGAFGAAVLVLVALVWWTMRRGKDQDDPAETRG